MSDRSELDRRRAQLSQAKRDLLAEWLTGRARHRSIPRRRDDGPAPLSFAQERLWFLEQLLPGTRAYWLPTALTLSGPLEPEPLRRALAEVVRRHEVLRTRFPAPGGRAAQVVDPPWEPELADTPDESPFDLAAGRVVRAHLTRSGQDEHLLTVTTHHIVGDAWSQRVLVRELAALYEAYADDAPTPLPEPPIQYADFAVWQRDQLAGPGMAGQLEHWRAALSGVPTLELPADRPRPATPTQAGATHRHTLSPSLLGGLQDLASATGTTLYMVVLAALATLLRGRTGETDIAVGTPVAGRGSPDVEGLIGFFANTVVLRVDLSGGPTARELLGRVRTTALAAFEHAEVPFARVVEELRLPRELTRTPLFQVQLVVQDAPPEPVALRGGLVFDVATLDTGGAQVDLSFAFSRGVCRIDYSTDLFDPDTVSGMAEELVDLLAAMVRAPDRVLPGSTAPRPSAPTRVEPRARPPYRAPVTELEQSIASVWAHVLGVDRVGLDETFFELGGHSVRLIQAHSALRAATGRAVEVVDLFAHPTVAALAAHLDKGDRSSQRVTKSRQVAAARLAALSRVAGTRGGAGEH
ncbi:aryl carrier-like protein [Actinokineospora baliensis]|uniref:condensation domain-containing protein n=1 Tax=Actinokineospora baliensis TaxID=547056 RepID=UPI001959B109|nr:condensation domain-containing protein [Actinokineospora baliensis]MBM7774664.1 aryl carrier-like protein [Actinokineospora baliensis]